MPSLKIYPPVKLPDKNVSETQFNMWQEELEVYLSQESNFKVFLPNKIYANWQCAEENPDRIDALLGTKVEPNDDRDIGPIISQQEADEQNENMLEDVRTSLRTVLSIVGKCVSEGHYNAVVRHSTSLQWIYNMLRCDYDIQNKGVHFFNILDAKYDPAKMTPIAFYNSYRTLISNNLAKTGDTIKFKDNQVLIEDEKYSPMLEDLTLLNVIREIDPKLPAFVKTHYFHKMKKDDHLMDFKTDILINIPHFLQQVNNSSDVASNNAIKQNKKFNFSRRPSKNGYPNGQKKGLYCRFCFLEKKPKNVYTSHNFGDQKHCSISQRDRQTFIENAKMANIQDEDDSELDEDELAELYGYGKNLSDHDEDEDDNQVLKRSEKCSKSKLFRNSAKCSYIKPVPSQILTVFKEQNKKPFHIDLDSGATCNYIRESEAIKHNFFYSSKLSNS